MHFFLQVFRKTFWLKGAMKIIVQCMVLDHDSAPVYDTHWKFKLPPTCCCMASRVAALPRLIITSTSVLYRITHQIKKNQPKLKTTVIICTFSVIHVKLGTKMIQ